MARFGRANWFSFNPHSVEAAQYPTILAHCRQPELNYTNNVLFYKNNMKNCNIVQIMHRISHILWLAFAN